MGVVLIIRHLYYTDVYDPAVYSVIVNSAGKIEQGISMGFMFLSLSYMQKCLHMQRDVRQL